MVFRLPLELITLRGGLCRFQAALMA